MHRYYMEVLVRGDREDGYVTPDSLAERTLRCHCTAPDELRARRYALERAWHERLLVSRFLSIRTRILP